MRLVGLAALAVLLFAGSGSGGTVVCRPYILNTSPFTIAIAWDGFDPESASPGAGDCVVGLAYGYRVVFARADDGVATARTVDVTRMWAVLTELTPATTFRIVVEALSAQDAVLPDSRSAAITVTTDRAITGEVRSFGFVSAQQAVMQQLTFFDNGFPFVLEGTADAGGAQRLTLTAGANGAAVDVAHFAKDGAAHFSASVTAGSLVVGDVLLNVSASSGTLTVGSAGVLRVDAAAERVGFGSFAAIATSTGELVATGATLDALRVGGAFAVEGTTGVATAAALDVGVVTLRGVSANLTIAREGVALALGADGSSAAFTVVFDAALNASGSGAPAINVPANTLAVGAIVPSNAADALTLRRVRRITSDSQLLLSGDGGGGLGIVLVPSESRIGTLRTLQFDPTSAQMLSLGGITLQATGAADGQLLVGDAGGVLFASSELQTVSVGDHILADAASGDLSAAHMFATSTVQARLRLAVSHADEARNSSTSLQHELLTVSAGTLLEPGELRLQAGAVLDGPALTLCANGARCALPSIASSASALDVFVNQSDSPVARFEGGRITVRGELHADGVLVTPQLSAAGPALNVTVGSERDAASALLAFNVGGSAAVVALTPAELLVRADSRFLGKVDVQQQLAVAGRMRVGGQMDMDANITMRYGTVLTASAIASDGLHPLQLESDHSSGVHVKVLGGESVRVTSTGVIVAGGLEVGGWTMSQRVHARASNLTLSTDATGVDFEVGNATVGRVSAEGLTMAGGRNLSVPASSAIVLGDMQLRVDAAGSWRDASPALVLERVATSSGSGAVVVAGDLQVDAGTFVRGSVWVGGDLVLSDPTSRTPVPTPANSSASCEQGTLRWDADFIYVCVASSLWKRANLSAF